MGLQRGCGERGAKRKTTHTMLHGMSSIDRLQYTHQEERDSAASTRGAQTCQHQLTPPKTLNPKPTSAGGWVVPCACTKELANSWSGRLTRDG